jgi:hypothetical protein
VSDAVTPRAVSGLSHRMAPYDDWNRIDDEEEEELQDTSVRLLNQFVPQGSK